MTIGRKDIAQRSSCGSWLAEECLSRRRSLIGIGTTLLIIAALLPLSARTVRSDTPPVDISDFGAETIEPLEAKKKPQPLPVDMVISPYWTPPLTPRSGSTSSASMWKESGSG